MSNSLTLSKLPKLELKTGRALDPIFIFKDNDLNVIDISTAEITLQCRPATEDPVVFTRQNTGAGGGNDEIEFVTDGSDGKIKVHFVPENTVSLEAGDYEYDFKVVIGGKPLTDGRSGIITIIKSITN